MQINWLAVLAAAAAVSAFVLGGPWYGPLFKHACGLFLGLGH